jgi:glycosyltransferase involved in cell wall biosynthesis
MATRQQSERLLSVVVVVTGEVSRLAADAKQLLFDLRYYAERDEHATQLVLIIDAAWRSVFSDEELQMPHARVVVLPTSLDHPGRMLNQCVGGLDTEWFALLGIGSEISTWYSNLTQWREQLGVSHATMIAGYRSRSEGRTAANESYLVHQNDQFSSDYPHAWLQMLDLVPMCNAFVRTSLYRAVGGFTESPALQRMWWWEFCLRVSRVHRIESIAMQPVPGPCWHQYAFAQDEAAPVAENLCALMEVGAETVRVTPARQDESPWLLSGEMRSQATLAAISPSWRSLPAALQSRLHNLLAQQGRPIEIVVVGGVNEPAHNQLCFFNYFSLMQRWGAVKWRAVLDERAVEDDVVGADLVIFSRVRNDNGVALMGACKKHNIRTLYMLDDNWFWLGREWDEYAPIFSPGAPPYENFLKLVSDADLVLTYRQPLAEDLAPHAKSVSTLPTNVDLRAFSRTIRRGTKTPRLKIGYVGSLRKNMLAFDALVEIARKREDVDIFVMSNKLPDEFASLPAERVHFEPYQFNYGAYAATVVAAAPDVLVAPVGKTRFEASKCPNKFLEISAAGAVGVYSRAEPYTSYIEDGVTGLFADDSVASWTAAITTLLDDARLRERIAACARAHVAAEFDTAAVLPAFLAILLDALSVP